MFQPLFMATYWQHEYRLWESLLFQDVWMHKTVTAIFNNTTTTTTTTNNNNNNKGSMGMGEVVPL